MGDHLTPSQDMLEIYALKYHPYFHHIAMIDKNIKRENRDSLTSNRSLSFCEPQTEQKYKPENIVKL